MTKGDKPHSDMEPVPLCCTEAEPAVRRGLGECRRVLLSRRRLQLPAKDLIINDLKRLAMSGLAM